MNEVTYTDNLEELTTEDILFGDDHLTPKQYQRRMLYYRMAKDMAKMSVKSLVEMRKNVYADIDEKAGTLHDPDGVREITDLLISLAMSEAAEREGSNYGTDEATRIFNQLIGKNV